jgi:peptidoglycan/LPS O-acetylase OafA/YrhL
MSFLNKSRLAAIDGIRGVAILAVVIVHVAYTTPVVGREFIKAASLLRYGVDLFFAISGWILCHNYFRLAAADRPSVWQMVIVRAIRLYPLYWLGMLAYGVGPVLIYGSPWPDKWLLWTNFALMNAWGAKHSANLVPGGWTISAELCGGVALLCFIPWIRSLPRAVFAWVLVVALTRTIHVGLPGDTTWWHLPTFFGGVVAWHLNATAIFKGRVGEWLGAGSLGLACILYISLHGAMIGVWDRSLQAGTAGVLVILFAASRSWSSAPARWLSGLGEISYPVYLVHFIVIEVCSFIIVGLSPGELPGWLLFGLVLLSTLLVSEVMSRRIELGLDGPLRKKLRRHFVGA